MKTLKISLQNAQCNSEEISKKFKMGIFSKSLIVIIMLSCATLLTSCMVFVPFHGHGGGHEHHGRR